MSPKMNIAITFINSDLAKSIMPDLQTMVDIQVHTWNVALEEKGELAIKNRPDIIIIDDEPDTGVIFKRMTKLRKAFPQAAIFVVSTDKHPEHIVEVMKAGATEYLVTPLIRKILSNSIEEIRVKLAESGKIAKGEVYSFISSKGGLGASILSVNTAAALALSNDSNKAVALCDMSFQAGDASVLLDIVPDTTISDICKNFHRLDVSLLKSAMAKHGSGLELLAAPTNPEDHEDIRPGQTDEIIKLLAKLYDRIIIDCQSMWVSDSTIEIFRNSRKVFIVIDPSLPAVRNAVRLTHLICKTGISENNIEFLLNRYEKGLFLSIEATEKSLGKKLYWLFPNDFSDIISSINEGTPVVQLAPRSLISKNIMSFCEKLMNKNEHPEYRGAKNSFGRYI